MSPKLNTKLIVSSALASVLALGLVAPLAAQDKPAAKEAKEKCYGIAKAGMNDCANQAGTHSCAGQSKVDMSADDWKYVAKGTCKDMNGLSEAEAKMKAKKT